jgi:hypothetical protein
MKLRLDLLEFLTAEDILEEAGESVHRYDPEPKFSKTGIGSLRPATPEERLREEMRATALVEKLKKRKRDSQLKATNPAITSTEPSPQDGQHLP